MVILHKIGYEKIVKKENKHKRLDKKSTHDLYSPYSRQLAES